MEDGGVTEDSTTDRRFGVLLTLAYNGTAYHGWALQKNARTVEEVLRGAIFAVDSRASSPRGTSRTDAGVHAEGQLVAFDAHRELPPRSWVLALNGHLPEDVCVRSARAVPTGFTPRFASRAKRYRYRLLLDRVRDPFWCQTAWRIEWDLDLDRLRCEAVLATGTHDFAAFRSASDGRIDTVRTLTRVAVECGQDPRRVSVVVEGDAFLHNMVRILVGTLVDVARGRLPEGAIGRALASGDRRHAGVTAPAAGLTLEWIDAPSPAGYGAPWPPALGWQALK